MFNKIKNIGKKPRFHLSINATTFSFNADYTLLQVCSASNLYIPTFCYSEQFSISGNCRMCLVEVGGCPKPSISCTSKIIPNMYVHTHSPMIKKVRESVLESLLLNHPLDCPVCDAGSECDLQDYSNFFGGKVSRNELFLKRSVQDKNMGFFIKTIMSRCIHCTRCIRFLSDNALTDILGMVGRGEKVEISFYFEDFLDTSLLAGNIIDVCPVGSFKGSPISKLPKNFYTKEPKATLALAFVIHAAELDQLF
jgi:NADH-quinone oxidoreductase subunit G